MITLTLNINDLNNKHVEITDILTFDMDVKKNCHTEARITGVVSENIGNALVFQQSNKSTMSISETKDNDVQTIFCGIVNDIELHQEGRLYIVKVIGISFTIILDIEKKCRSFQNIDITYEELVKQVLADTESADVLFCATDHKIGVPVYQYEETDWEFLKRVASQLETSAAGRKYAGH